MILAICSRLDGVECITNEGDKVKRAAQNIAQTRTLKARFILTVAIPILINCTSLAGTRVNFSTKVASPTGVLAHVLLGQCHIEQR